MDDWIPVEDRKRLDDLPGFPTDQWIALKAQLGTRDREEVRVGSELAKSATDTAPQEDVHDIRWAIQKVVFGKTVMRPTLTFIKPSDGDTKFILSMDDLCATDWEIAT
jgi:hypothetical protein